MEDKEKQNPTEQVGQNNSDGAANENETKNEIEPKEQDGPRAIIEKTLKIYGEERPVKIYEDGTVEWVDKSGEVKRESLDTVLNKGFASDERFRQASAMLQEVRQREQTVSQKLESLNQKIADAALSASAKEILKMADEEGIILPSDVVENIEFEENLEEARRIVAGQLKRKRDQLEQEIQELQRHRIAMEAKHRLDESLASTSTLKNVKTIKVNIGDSETEFNLPSAVYETALRTAILYGVEPEQAMDLAQGVLNQFDKAFSSVVESVAQEHAERLLRERLDSEQEFRAFLRDILSDPKKANIVREVLKAKVEGQTKSDEPEKNISRPVKSVGELPPEIMEVLERAGIIKKT